MTASKDEMEQFEKPIEEEPQTPLRRNRMNSHHSLDELLKVAMDMGDQRVIDAIMKKINE